MNNSKKFSVISAKSALLTTFTFAASYLCVFIIFPNSFWKDYFGAASSRIISDIFINLLFCLIVTKSSLFIDHQLNKRVPWLLHPLKRLVLQFVLQVFFVLSLAILIGILCQKLINSSYINSYPTSPREGLYMLISIIILILMVSALNTGSFLIRNWKESTIKASEYKVKVAQNKQLAAETELQALKQQLDPHFAFNSLSVLSELILRDQQVAYEYTENFAKVYRYLLVNSKRKLITLGEELRFLDAYLFLTNIRMGGRSIVEIEICRSKHMMMIPPATLQLLIENAVKHNRTEEGAPLIVSIYSNENNEIVVSNQLLPLRTQIASTGIGLANIIRRYALLDDRIPSIQQNNENFIVKLPLIL